MKRSIHEIAHSRALAAKLGALIALAAFMGVSLLETRQRRLAAAHELAVLHAQSEEDARTALRLRQEIADRVALPRIQKKAVEQGFTAALLPNDAPHRETSTFELTDEAIQEALGE